MHRRVAVPLILGVASAVAPTALAQTTTSSSSSTSTSSTSTATTSTTVPNRCTGQVCTELPPDAFLAGGGGEVRLARGSSCWTSPTPNAQGFFVGICSDVLQLDPMPRLPSPRRDADPALPAQRHDADVPPARGGWYDPGPDARQPGAIQGDFPAGSTPVIRSSPGGSMATWVTPSASTSAPRPARPALAPAGSPSPADRVEADVQPRHPDGSDLAVHRVRLRDATADR